MKVLGLMTGTSMDGLDVCYADIHISKEYLLDFNMIDSKIIKLPNNLINQIKKCILKKDKKNIYTTHHHLGVFFADAVEYFLDDRKIDLISMHGQTISHINSIISHQIGHPKYLYNKFNIPVAYDFRSLDIKMGGNGAPLMPFLDWLLYKDIKLNTLTLNIGGISNITYIPKTGNRDNVVGFDTGPGMCLIDQYVSLIWNDSNDFNAKYSKEGKINQDLLKALMKDKYVLSSKPKSTSIENYDMKYLKKIISQFNEISCEDFLRTLVNYTAESINYNIKNFLNINTINQLVISGGGINHPLLYKDLCLIINIEKIEKFLFQNIDSNFKEAFLMCVLGYTKYYNLYNNMKSVTNVNQYKSYGKIYE